MRDVRNRAQPEVGMRAAGDAIVVYRPPTNRRAMIAGGASFLVTAVICLSMDGLPPDTYFMDTSTPPAFVFWTLLAALMVVGAAICFILAATARRRKVALIVNQVGVVDWCSHGLRGNQGMTPWEEIESVTAEVAAGPVVMLESLVIRRLKTPALAGNRPLLDVDPSLRAHDSYTTGVVRIYATQIDAPVSDVARAINDYLRVNPPPGWRGDPSAV